MPSNNVFVFLHHAIYIRVALKLQCTNYWLRLGWTVLCAVIWKYLTSLSLRLVLFLYIPSTSIRGWLFSISKLIEPMHFFYIFDVAKNGCSLLAWLIDINKRHHHHAFTSPGTISNEHSGIYNTRRRRTKICWGKNYFDGLFTSFHLTILLLIFITNISIVVYI